jgi:hypothetical protein
MLELDHLPALLANQVLVLRIPVIVLKERPRAQIEPPQQSGIDQFGQCPVNSGPANIQTSCLQIVDQLIRVKMMMPSENMLYKFSLLAGEPLGARSTRNFSSGDWET